MLYSWLTENADKKQREEFDAKLNQPPPQATKAQVKATPQWDVEANANDFMAQLAARGGGAGRLSVQGVRNVEQ